MSAHSPVVSQLPLPPMASWRSSLRGFKQSPPDFLLDLYRAHGDILRFRGFFTVYCLNHPEFVRQVLTKAWPDYTKKTIDYRVIAGTLGKGLVTNDGPDWAHQRRLMQPVFANRHINKFDTVINDMTALTAERWRAAGEDPVRLDLDMSRVAFQVVSRTLFGAEIDEVADEMVGFLNELNQHPLRLSALLTMYPRIPLPSNRRFLHTKARLHEIVDGLVAAHGTNAEGEPDIVDHLLAARDEDSGLGMDADQIRDEIITLMLAGHETSATSLTWTFYLLSQHPEIEQRLLAELDQVLGGRPATSADLANLPYLKQVVQESMRIYPPVWGIARRSSEDSEFGGFHVPANSYLAITMHVLHRHPEFWSEPERFDPDRFAPGSGKSRHSYAYLPFAAGPRACIGASMAMLEVQLVLAQLIQQFRVTPVAGHPVIPEAVVTLKTRFGMPVTVKSR
jgi:cytochrome P450